MLQAAVRLTDLLSIKWDLWSIFIAHHWVILQTATSSSAMREYPMFSRLFTVRMDSATYPDFQGNHRITIIVVINIKVHFKSSVYLPGPTWCKKGAPAGSCTAPAPTRRRSWRLRRLWRPRLSCRSRFSSTGKMVGIYNTDQNKERKTYPPNSYPNTSSITKLFMSDHFSVFISLFSKYSMLSTKTLYLISV